ncbi:hypothetical protein GF312_13460 [Candidatus Poribacteria bacterium]|nr:hypothetical protein [Candidatus Poribacteria bacterium]
MGGKYDLGNFWWVPHNKTNYVCQARKPYDRPAITVRKNGPKSSMIVIGSSIKKRQCIKVTRDDFPLIRKSTYINMRSLQPVLKSYLRNYKGLLPKRLRDELRQRILRDYGINLYGN